MELNGFTRTCADVERASRSALHLWLAELVARDVNVQHAPPDPNSIEPVAEALDVRTCQVSPQFKMEHD